MGFIFGGGGRNRQFRQFRLALLAMVILSAIVFKGHSAIYHDIRIGYYVVLLGFVAFSFYAIRKERRLERLAPPGALGTGMSAPHDDPPVTGAPTTEPEPG